MANKPTRYSCLYIHVCDDVGPAYCGLCKHSWRDPNDKRTKFEMIDDPLEYIDNIKDITPIKRALLEKTIGLHKGEETMNFLYSIEGTDKSGKETQTKNIIELLRRIVKRALLNTNPSNVPYIDIFSTSYPRYESESSFHAREYLAGKFGDEPNLINPMMASVFYAVDRCHHYHTTLKPRFELELHNNMQSICITDRYVGSNLVHQGANFNSRKEIVEFCREVQHLEYNIMGIMKPSKTFFLDVPPEVSFNLRKNEALKTGGDKDILEGNYDHIKKAYDNGKFIAIQEDWIIIPCTKNGEFRPVREITVDIVRYIMADFISKNKLDTTQNEDIAMTINSVIDLYLS